MNPPRDLLGTVVTVSELLERLKLKYAFGGAIAQNYWGTVRATQDVDLLVSVPKLRYQEFADELNAAGFRVRDSSGGEWPISVEEILLQERDRHFFTCHLVLVKVDFFFPFVALQRSLLDRVQRVAFQGKMIPVTSAEDLILLKLIFHREKDLRDVQAVLWNQKGKLDLGYLRQEARKILSAENLRELETLLSRYS